MSRSMPSRLSKYIAKQAVLKELLWNSHKIKICGGVFVLKLAGMYPFTGALKTTFSKTVSNKSKVLVNEDTEIISRASYKL